MTQIKIPFWFTMVAVIMLVWNFMGVIAFFIDISLSAEDISQLSFDEKQLYARYPFWTKIAYGFAVLGGFFGCVALLLKKHVARVLLLLSLIGIVIQMTHSIFVAKAMDVYGAAAVIMPIVVMFLGIFLVLLANHAIKKEWIK